MTELQRDAPFFDKVLVIRLQSGLQEARQIPLTVRIIPGIRPSSIHGQNEKLFHFEVTDENDPYFLYVLDVGEQDFHHLKRDQSLLVEFPVFPSKLIELIELCLLSSRSNNTVASSSSSSAHDSSSSPSAYSHTSSSFDQTSSTFTANLEIVTGVFTIVESNKFKQLNHISLLLRPGNDAAVKGYLSSRLAFITSVANKRKVELDASNTELKAEKEQRAELATNFSELRSLRDNDAQIARSLHMEEMSNMRMENLIAMEAERAKNESNLSLLKGTLDAVQLELRRVKDTSEQSISELSLSKSQLDFKVRELSSQFNSVQADRTRLTEENSAYQNARKKLEEQRSSLEKDLARLEAKYEASLQQLDDRRETMLRTTALLQAGEEARAALEEKLSVYVENLEYLQSQVETGGSQISRGNAAVERLQGESRQLRDKIKLKSEIIRKQEALVTDLRSQGAEQGQEITRGRDALHALKLQSEAQQRQILEVQDRLADSSKVIASNQEVISYLNEEINKWHMGLSLTGTASYKHDNKYDNNYDINTAGHYGSEFASDVPYRTASSLPSSSSSAPSGSRLSGIPTPVYRNASYPVPEYPANSKKSSSMNVISFSPDTPGLSPNHTANNYSGGVGAEGDGDGVASNAYSDRRSSSEKKTEDHVGFNTEHGRSTYNAFESEKESGRDILLRGIQNLGLGSSFGSLEGLGLDLSLGNDKSDLFFSSLRGGQGQTVPPHSDRQVTNISAVSKRVAVGGAGERNGTGVGSRDRGVDLESLAYYATGSRSARMQSQ